MAFDALWFDGQSSRARPVRVVLEPGPRGPSLRIAPQDGGAPVLVPHRQVGWPEAWSAQRAPRKLVVDLADAGSLEVEDVAGLRAALDASGRRAPLAQRMQTRWTVFVAVLLVAAALIGAFYRWGTPWAATQLTRAVPLAWETALTQRWMGEIDRSMLRPSRLPPERQQALRARFDALAAQVTPELRRYGAYAPPLQLHFRRGMGANAFALPGGTIVMTDAMVEAAAQHKLPDEALVGVLAHEIGHVVHRHTTRLVVEQAVLNIGLGLALGDVSTLLSMGASVLTGLSYRRGHETEADCFAVALMRKAGLSTAPMADLLANVSPDGRNAESNAWVGMLSTHPDTPRRARDLRDGHAEGCR